MSADRALIELIREGFGFALFISVDGTAGEGIAEEVTSTEKSEGYYPIVVVLCREEK